MPPGRGQGRRRAQHRAPRSHGRLGLQPAGRGQVRLHPRYAAGARWGRTGRPGCHAPLSTWGRGGPRVPRSAGAAGGAGDAGEGPLEGGGEAGAGCGVGQDLLSSAGAPGGGGWEGRGSGLPSAQKHLSLQAQDVFLLSPLRACGAETRGKPWFLEISLGVPAPSGAEFPSWSCWPGFLQRGLGHGVTGLSERPWGGGEGGGALLRGREGRATVRPACGAPFPPRRTRGAKEEHE